MAVEQYPSFLQDEEYSAETLRHVFGTLLARGSAIGSIVGGLVASTDMQVTAGSGMQVLVATGEAWIPGSSASTQGGYLGRVTSSTALAISAASESNPRIETIIAQVQDKAVAGGTDSFSVSVVVGTATSGAKLEGGGKPGAGVGSVPASSLVLAYVLVPAKAVSIVSGDIENVAKLVVLEGASVRQETGTPQSFLSWGEIGVTGGTIILTVGTGDYIVKRVASGEYAIEWSKEKSSENYGSFAQGQKTTTPLTYFVKEQTKAKVVFKFSEDPSVFIFFVFAAS